MSACLERAWSWRESRGVLSTLPAVRVFHGPGEGEGPWKEIAIERFGPLAWVTAWGEGFEPLRQECARFLKGKGISGAAVVTRPVKGIASLAEPLFGELPAQAWVEEGRARYAIRFHETRHPGLFLDHEPLRAWLSAHSLGWRVLNTFAYTGSLSVAAGLGGAREVTTLDLSRPTVEWAKQNWVGNRLPEEGARFIAGDFFDWAPRLARRGERYDCVILDPPSFSRGTKGTFSTSKDLGRLHAAAFALLADDGVLVSSINSAAVPRERFEAELEESADEAGVALELLRAIELPETFPARTEEERYLKGGVYRCSTKKLRARAPAAEARRGAPAARPRRSKRS
jgi:23S rRNA G2069 N7-methylase RlmK/C1962 C5-methylase RlmI